MTTVRPSEEWSVRQADVGDRAVLATFLASTPRVHQHLDWVGPLDLLDLPPFLMAFERGLPAGCLAIPEDPPGVAWLRLFAVGSGQSPEGIWGRLWPSARRIIAGQGVARAAALTLNPWLPPLLRKAGFDRSNSVVFLEWDRDRPPERPAHPGQIRKMTLHDLSGVERVDRAAFGPLWRHSLRALDEALHQAAYATIIEVDGQSAAYQISTSTHLGAHLARLAVDPAWQGSGMGEALVADLLHHFARAGVPRVTVNTQGDNTRSHRLYEKLGFKQTEQSLDVYELKLKESSP